MKRRLNDASLPTRLSPHSSRVIVITDLLEQRVSHEDVQRLAGHADRHYAPLRPPIAQGHPDTVERISI